MNNFAVCLMGTTAAGKTDVAIELCQHFPFDIVSVDSALVYRGMDIGTAKPDAATLRRTPHRLIDIRDPEERYSAGDFVRDARREMASIFAAGRWPLLVGGTMLYFRALTRGLAKLPQGDADVRAAIDADALERGWPVVHARLREVDPAAAKRINPNDSQRIQRALEVFEISGRSLTDWQDDVEPKQGGSVIEFVKIALQIPQRQVLHDRIEKRLDTMFRNGFVDEVAGLMQRPALTPELPSMRAVGYRQVWAHLTGQYALEEAQYRALVATRQLAKRQITWLRSETELFSCDPLEAACVDTISAFLEALPRINNSGD
ncbi:MAG: tRNA (adenosine(37)-N6)-dimethylallyltransferase MiaA [Proteobacteria bacterium]|nr:tRNA (adenosine(37)-N6)-dimethylallyltransferase MiaA [Pseudomonadota bacterium]